MDFRMIAHDMRTPLGALNLSIQTARKAQNSEQLKQALDIAERNAAALSNIIESLLDTTATGMSRLTFRECFPLDLITCAIDQIAPQADAKHLRVTAGELIALPPIMADGTRLVRVLVNLLSNAVRFSPLGGEIQVVTKLRSNDGHPAVVFSVIDEGPGVAQQHVDRIFVEGVSIAKGGKYSSGLGLAVCKELVKSHEGHIWVETGRACGAAFSFSIPVTRQHIGQELQHRSSLMPTKRGG